MMKNSRRCPPCFSSQCDFCDTCCGRGTETYPTSSFDCLAQAEGLAKFSGDLSTQIEGYRNKIGILMHRDQAGLPKGIEVMTGVIPERFKVDEAIFKSPSVYKRLETPHGAICDTPKCKTMYTGSPEYFHMSWFPHIPVYTREHDDGCQLCILCLKKQGEPILPKL
jgi:hypothetical protein